MPAALAYRHEGLLSANDWLWSLRPRVVVNDLPILQDRSACHMVSRPVKELIHRLRPATVLSRDM